MDGIASSGVAFARWDKDRCLFQGRRDGRWRVTNRPTVVTKRRIELVILWYSPRILRSPALRSPWTEYTLEKICLM